MYKRSDWDFTHGNESSWGYPWWMDVRHRLFLYRLVSSGLFKNVLEVGCYRGSSASAYLQALNDGAEFNLTLCDAQVHPVLLDAVSKCRKQPTIRAIDSLQAINGDFDLIVVDGDHRIAQVSREIGLFLFHQTPTIVAHDTNASHIPGCEGAVYLGTTFKNHPEYACLEDRVKRDGEYTERGMLFATRSKPIFDGVKPVWEKAMKLRKEEFL